MRVIGGKHRGRAIEGPAGEGVRPTSDRARESLFNILEHGRFSEDGTSLLPGARVLDVFSGTGAFAIEALSRGAADATLIDNDPAAMALARRNLRTLGETAHATLVQADATRPPPAPRLHEIVFLDPPYASGLGVPALEALAAAGWLAPGAVCIVETGSKERFAPPQGFLVLDERRYGRAKLSFLRREEDMKGARTEALHRGV
jgi:16S rRNA (guanine966-N2)-methyltransferase